MIEEFHKGFSIPNITSDPRSHQSPNKDTKRDGPGTTKKPTSIYFSDECSMPDLNPDLRTIREEQNESSTRFNRPNSLFADPEQRRKNHTDFEEWTKELAKSEQMLKDLGNISSERPPNPYMPDKEKASHVAAHSSHFSNTSGQSNICFSEKNSTNRISEFQTNKGHQTKKSWTGTGVQVAPLSLQKPLLLAVTNPNFSPIQEIPEAPSSSRDRLYRMVELSQQAILSTSPCNNQQKQIDSTQRSAQKRQSQQIEIDNCDDASENSNDRKLVKRIDMCDVQLVAFTHADDQKSNSQREL